MNHLVLQESSLHLHPDEVRHTGWDQVFQADACCAIEQGDPERFKGERFHLKAGEALLIGGVPADGGAGNARGGRTAAVLSSLTSTCRRHGVDPQLYLTQLLANLPAWPM